MNFFLLYAHEIGPDGGALVLGERVSSFFEARKPQSGALLPIVVYGRSRGCAEILEFSQDRLSLKVVQREPAPPKLPIHCIVGACRPQTVKKVLQIAATTGVGSLHLVRAANSEKSYLQSKILAPSQLEHEIRLAIEQSGDPLAPQVCVHRTFSWFVREHLAPELKRLGSFAGFIADAHGASKRRLSVAAAPCRDKPVFLAVGPESGWEPNEVQEFLSLGFAAIDLGPRTLRIETALNILLGQILLLREPA